MCVALGGSAPPSGVPAFTPRPGERGFAVRGLRESLRVQNRTVSDRLGQETCRKAPMHYPYPWLLLSVTFPCGGL